MIPPRAALRLPLGYYDSALQAEVAVHDSTQGGASLATGL
jgi:hypothetical protein